MAVFEEGINGPFNGKVGNVIGYKWRDIWVMRSLSKPSNKPRSKKQLANQAKFALMQELLSEVRDFVQVGFSLKPETRRMSPQNAAMSYNLKNAIKGEFPDFEIDFEKVILAQGDFEFPENLHFEQNEDMLEITWDAPSIYDKRKDAQLMYMLIDTVAVESYGAVFGEHCKKGIQRRELETIRLNRNYHCFAAFVSSDRKQVSDSVYWGILHLEDKKPKEEGELKENKPADGEANKEKLEMANMDTSESAAAEPSIFKSIQLPVLG